MDNDMILNEVNIMEDSNRKVQKCNCKTEVFSRVTGFYRPVENFNIGKKQEFKDRKTYEQINRLIDIVIVTEDKYKKKKEQSN